MSSTPSGCCGRSTGDGAKLESTLERVDDSSTGMLLYGVMASLNAFHSRRDGEKVKVGLERKFPTVALSAWHASAT